MTRHPSLAKATAFLLLAAVGGTAIIGGCRAPSPQPTPPAQAGKPPSLVGAVKFDHEYHIDKQQIACPVCHHETTASALTMPHKDYFDDFWIDCTICHKSGKTAPSDPQACSTCHHSSPTGIADETLSAKVVIHKKCWECHDAGRGEAASKGCATCHAKAPHRNAAPPATPNSLKKG
ncbi:MAG: cytochrome c3 family protein [Gemmatimonadaceae bacterium]